MIPDGAAAGVGRALAAGLAPRSATRGRWLDGSPATARCSPCSSSSASTPSTSSPASRSRWWRPTIADHFGVGMAGVTVPFVLSFAAGVRPVGADRHVADRGNRVRLALLGGLVFAVFSTLVGLSPSIWMVAFFLAGSQIGKAFIEPSHTSLLADYYEVGLRPRIFSFHRAGNAVGALIGGITAGYIAEAFSWRAPFFVFAVPDGAARARGRPAARAGARRPGEDAHGAAHRGVARNRGGRRRRWPRRGACAGRSTACAASTARCRS